MQNRYAGKCDVCAAYVAEQAGETRKIEGRWRVFCAAHSARHPAPARPAAPPALPVPQGISLFAHQREGIEWLRARGAAGKGALLADDMGLGKTAQTLLSLPARAPVLVVCPAVAKTVWVRETAKFAPSYRAATINGRGNFRWPEAGEVLAVNFDILPRPVKAGGFAALPAELLAGMPEGLCVVIDEAHKCKNAKAQRTQALRAITYAARKERNGRVVLLTGTPLLNKPQEVWSILVAGGMQYEAFGPLTSFGGDVYRAAMRAAGGNEGTYGWQFDPRMASPAFAESLAKVMLRRRKADVLDLPPVREEDVLVEIDLTATDRRALDGLSAKDVGMLRRGTPEFEGMSRAREILARAKIPALLDLVEDCEEQEEPVLVFSAHRAPVDACAAREGWASITGDTSADERGRIEQAFQRGELRGVAATIAAAGVALTLTRASRVIFADLDWTPANNDQARDRANRIGQTQSVLVTTLVADHPLDERINSLIGFKRSLNEATVEAAANEERPALAPMEHPVVALPEPAMAHPEPLLDFSDLPF